MAKINSFQNTPSIIADGNNSMKKVIADLLNDHAGDHFLPPTEAELSTLATPGLPILTVIDDGGGSLFALRRPIGIQSGARIWSDLLGIAYQNKSGNMWSEMQSMSKDADRVQKMWDEARKIQAWCITLADLFNENVPMEAPFAFSDPEKLSAQKMIAISVQIVSGIQSLRGLVTEHTSTRRNATDELKQWLKHMFNIHEWIDKELTPCRDSLGAILKPEAASTAKRQWAMLEALKERIVNTRTVCEKVREIAPVLDAFSISCGEWVSRVESWLLDVHGGFVCGEVEDARLLCKDGAPVLEESAASGISSAYLQPSAEYWNPKRIMLGNEQVV